MGPGRIMDALHFTSHLADLCMEYLTYSIVYWLSLTWCGTSVTIKDARWIDVNEAPQRRSEMHLADRGVGVCVVI